MSEDLERDLIPSNLLAYIAVAIIGFLIVTYGSLDAYGRMRLLNECIHTKGQVIRNRKEGGSYDVSEIEFQSARGAKIITVHPELLPVGEQVEIYYLPSDPNHPQVKSFLTQWALPLCVVFIGGIIFLFGSAMAFLNFRRQREISALLSGARFVPATITYVVQVVSKLELMLRTNPYGEDGGEHQPYRVRAEWKDKDTDEEFEYESDIVWISSRRPPKVGNTIKVYVQEFDVTSYYLGEESFS